MNGGKKTVYKSAQPRDIARMAEKYDLYEVLREMSAMLDGLDQSEQRQAMAALAERYKMKLAPQTTSSGSGYRPNVRRKTKPI